VRTILWIRSPFPFRSDEARAMQETLERLYGASGLRAVTYLMKPRPGRDPACVDAVVLQGGDEVLRRQVAITVQAIHLHHPSPNVEVTRGERPAWVPALAPSLNEAWTFSTATGFRTAQR
jgi:hypothetical protein